MPERVQVQAQVQAQVQVRVLCSNFPAYTDFGLTAFAAQMEQLVVLLLRARGLPTLWVKP